MAIKGREKWAGRALERRGERVGKVTEDGWKGERKGMEK